MDRATFEAKLKALLAARKSATGNSGCVSCEACERCTDSTFCERSTGLVRSQYCKDSDSCDSAPSP